MAKDSKTARSLDILDKDIRRLQEKAKSLEEEIDQNFVYLQHHSATIFINSLFPGKRRERDERTEGLLQALLQNDRLQGTLHKLLTRLAEKGSGLINKLIDKWID